VATVAELKAIFVDATSANSADGFDSNDEMCSVHTWPLAGGRCGGAIPNNGSYYWSSAADTVVSMLNGVSYTEGGAAERNFVCVRH
jgi:hypothetical protein